MRVQHTSYGQRILGSFVGLLFGILLFLGSFVVLFINEGRENISKYARVATAYDEAGTYGPEQLVYTIGNLEATNYAQDSYLEAGDYILIQRSVEMYGYIEREHSETRENLGGSTDTITTYSYDLDWTGSPKPTTSFQGDATEIPTGIPADYNSWVAGMPQNAQSSATGLSIGGILVSAGVELSNAHDLSVDETVVQAAALLANEAVSSGQIFRKNSTSGSISTPGAGDIRITYRVIKSSDQGILFGAIEDGKFVSFLTKKNHDFFRFFAGVDSRTQAVQILQAEYKTMLWIFRLVGFMMMFIGLLLFANPIMTLISVIPLFAKIGRFVYGIFAFFVSLLLTGLTIIIGMIFNNIYLAIGVVAALIVIFVLILRAKRSRKPALKRS